MKKPKNVRISATVNPTIAEKIEQLAIKMGIGFSACLALLVGWGIDSEKKED